MGRVSRNHILRNIETGEMVAPRMGRVSRNLNGAISEVLDESRAPHGACE